MLLMESFTYSKVMMILLLGKACTPLYYIPVLLMFSLLLPYFLNLEKRNALILFSCFLALVCLGFTYWRYATGHKAVWFYLRYTPVWLPFYAIGIKMAYHEHEKNPLLVNRKYEKILILCVIMFLFIKFITMLLLGQNERMSGIIFSQLRFSSLIYSASLILFLIYLKEKELHFS